MNLLCGGYAPVHVGIVRINRQEGVGMKAREASEKDRSTKIRRIACCQVSPALDITDT
jgi:hypothetical protein